MGRPYMLPEPLKSLAEAAGGEAQLQEAMGGVPKTTFHRWKRLINSHEPLPRSAVAAINAAKTKFEEEKK